MFTRLASELALAFLFAACAAPAPSPTRAPTTSAVAALPPAYTLFEAEIDNVIARGGQLVPAAQAGLEPDVYGGQLTLDGEGRLYTSGYVQVVVVEIHGPTSLNGLAVLAAAEIAGLRLADDGFLDALDAISAGYAGDVVVLSDPALRAEYLFLRARW